MQRLSDLVQIGGRQELVQGEILHQLVVLVNELHALLQSSVGYKTHSRMETLGVLEDVEGQGYTKQVGTMQVQGRGPNATSQTTWRLFSALQMEPPFSSSYLLI